MRLFILLIGATLLVALVALFVYFLGADTAAWLSANESWLSILISVLGIGIGSLIVAAVRSAFAWATVRRKEEMIKAPMPDPTAAAIADKQPPAPKTKLPKGEVERLIALARAGLEKKPEKARALILRAALRRPRPSLKKMPRQPDFHEVYALADRQAQLGDNENARAALEIALALNLAETKTLAAAAVMGLASLDRRERRTPEAEKRLIGLTSDLRSIAKSAADDDVTQLAFALSQLGDVQITLGKTAEARTAFEEALKLRQALMDRAPQALAGQRQEELIQALFAVAYALTRAGDLSSALKLADEGERLARAQYMVNQQMFGQSANAAERELVRRLKLTAHRFADQLAGLIQMSGDLNAAIAIYEANLTAYRDIAKVAPDVTVDVIQDLLRLGAAREVAGDLEPALADARSALRLSEEAQRAYPKSPTPEPLIVASWTAIARCEELAGNAAEAETALSAALALQSAPQRRTEDSSYARLNEARLLLMRVRLAIADGDTNRASKTTDEVLKICKEQLDIDEDNLDARLVLLETRERLADLKLAMGDVEGAIAAYSEELALAERLMAEEPASLEYHRLAARARQQMGGALISAGDAVGAVKALRDAFNAMKRLSDIDPRNVLPQIDLLWMTSNLVDSYRRVGDMDAAVSVAEEAMQLADKLVLRDDKNASIRRGHAYCVQSKGQVAFAKGELIEALKFYRRTTKLLKEAAGTTPTPESLQSIASAIGGVALCLRELGEKSDAEKTCFEAIDALTRALEKSPTWGVRLDILWARARLVELYDEKASLKLAKEQVERLVQDAAALSKDAKHIAAVEEMLATAEEKRGDVALTDEKYDDAKAYYQLSLSKRLDMLKRSRKNLDLLVDAAASRACIGEAEYLAGDKPTALVSMRKAEQDLEAALATSPEDHWTKWALIMPRFRIAQMEADNAALQQLFADLRQLEQGGRTRVGQRLPWLTELRALANEQQLSAS